MTKARGRLSDAVITCLVKTVVCEHNEMFMMGPIHTKKGHLYLLDTISSVKIITQLYNHFLII